METKVIDFDLKFEEYMKNWLDEKSDSFNDIDEIEFQMPDIYQKWLDTPKEWLSGLKPSEYFNQFEKASELIILLVSYMSKNIGIPDPLFDSISEKKDASVNLLCDIVFNNYKLPRNIDITALKITALNLINEINPQKCIDGYIDLLKNENLNEAISDCLIDTIKIYGKKHKDVLIESLITSNNKIIKERFLEILVDLPYDKKVYNKLKNIFIKSNNKALYASFLGKYGNKDACELLINALDWMNINYLDYIEIKNAIEELGEEIMHNRNFEGDIYYESMKGLTNE